MKDDEVLALPFRDWPLPDAYLTELGRLAAIWCSLEAQLDMVVGKIAGFDALADFRPFILLKHAAFPQKLDALSALCDQLCADYPNLAEHAKVIGEVRSAQKLRNRFAHNGMSLNEANGRVEMAVGSARGKLKVGVETVTLADIRRATMQVQVAMLALHKLVSGKEYPPTWKRADG